MLSFFPRDDLDEILNLIESVSEGFPTYSFIGCWLSCSLFSFVIICRERVDLSCVALCAASIDFLSHLGSRARRGISKHCFLLIRYFITTAELQ